MAKKTETKTVAQIVAEINAITGGTLKPTAFKTKALAEARLVKVTLENKDKVQQKLVGTIKKDTATAKKAAPKSKMVKEPKKVAKKAEKLVKAVPQPATPIPLIATPAEVKELQAIRDLRLAGRAYKDQKTSFFQKFRAKYGITSSSRIKVETEDTSRLGVVQYCGNNRPVMLGAAA